MQLRVKIIVGTLLVASVLLTSVIGRSTCPEDRQCGDKICEADQVCQLLFPPCMTPPTTTLSPYCPPILECIERQCPFEEPPPPQAQDCTENYEPKMLKVRNCPYKIPTCVRKNCGNN